MDVNEIHTKIFQLNGVDDNNRYLTLTGDKINTVQVIEPALKVSQFVLPNKEKNDYNYHLDRFAFRVPLVSIDDYRLQQINITWFKLDYNGFLPTVCLDFMDTENVMLSTSVVKDGSIVKVYIGGLGDELYYKPIRQDFIITDIKKIAGGDQKYGDYFKYRIYGKLNVPFGYRKDAWSGGTCSVRQQLFNLAIYTGLGFATNFTNSDVHDCMHWVNNETSTYFEFMEDVSRHACYSPNTFFTSYIDQFNVLNFVECHSLLSHGGKKTDVPAMMYSSYTPAKYPNNEGTKEETKDQIPLDEEHYEDLKNDNQKVSYYYISNNDFFDGWSNYIEEYTEINKGISSTSDGYRKHLVYSDSNIDTWGFSQCEFIISPIDNLKRDGEQKIISIPEKPTQESYIPLNLMQMTKPEYQEEQGDNIDNLCNVESFISFGEVDTTNMFKQYYFAEVQNSYQMKCLKKCGLKVILQNYNPAITKFSRIWVDIYDKNMISSGQLVLSDADPENDMNSLKELREIKNKNLLVFDDEGVIEQIENEKMKNKNWPRGNYNRSLSGWYVITEMEIYFSPNEHNLKMKLMLNRIEYQPCFIDEYKVAQRAIEKYKNDNIVDDMINSNTDDYSYIK